MDPLHAQSVGRQRLKAGGGGHGPGLGGVDPLHAQSVGRERLKAVCVCVCVCGGGGC